MSHAQTKCKAGGACLHNLKAHSLTGLVYKGEAVEGAHDLALASIDDALQAGKCGVVDTGTGDVHLLATTHTTLSCMQAAGCMQASLHTEKA